MQCRYLGVAPSTRRTYQSGLNAFKSFCTQFGIAPFPASSLTLEYFYVQASQHISYKTLKVYLSGIRLAHLEQGFPDPTDSASLHLVCRGIRRQQGDNQRTRLPITINLLRVLKQQLRLCNSYTYLEKRMLWTVFTFAFYGFFQASELTSNLTWSDIWLLLNQISITLHQSKTDPFRHGQIIHIFATEISISPIKAMVSYPRLVGNTMNCSPIFNAGRFSLLTQKQVDIF